MKPVELSPKVVLRDATAADHAAMLAINQANTPAVSDLTESALQTLLGMACLARVAVVDGSIAGFLICLDPGQPYASVNYAWFTQRYERFLYVDRIALVAAAQRQGVGSGLYREAQALATRRGEPLLAEVNIEPRNEVSLAFHRHWGFAPVGEQDTPGNKRVVMLALNPI